MDPQQQQQQQGGGLLNAVGNSALAAGGGYFGYKGFKTSNKIKSMPKYNEANNYYSGLKNDLKNYNALSDKEKASKGMGKHLTHYMNTNNLSNVESAKKYLNNNDRAYNMIRTAKAGKAIGLIGAGLSGLGLYNVATNGAN